MAKAEPKTRPTDASVEDFLNSVGDERKREDSFTVMRMMTKLSGEKPVMWGSAIVGFGSSMMKYANGRELDWPELAFSPRKAGLTIYFAGDFTDQFDELLSNLGKHTTGYCCLYIKRLSDVDTRVLNQLIKASLKQGRSGGPVSC
jgi:hypothetical protein